MDKLCPVGYVRGGGSGVSQIEHFDDVRPYIVTINEFLSWLGVEYGIELMEMPYADRGMPPFHELLHEYFEVDEKKLKQERLIQEAHRRHAEQEYPRCVNCTKPLEVDEGAVYLFDHVTLAPKHYFGGYVCSEACDARLCLVTLEDMSDLDQSAHIGKALEQVERNWN